MRTVKKYLALTATMTATLGLAACGSDEKKTDTATTTGTSTAVEKNAKQTLSPNAEIEAIVATLKKADKAYASGDQRAAKELASSAYIDHFEELEEPLGKKNHELMEELEKQIGVEIPGLIRDKAPTTKVSSAIEKVTMQLPEAARALGAKSNSPY